MNARKRFLKTLQFGEPDRVFFMKPWYWASTLKRWHHEGLPRDVHVDEYFGTDRIETTLIAGGPVGPVWGVVGLCPAFERDILHRGKEYHIVRTPDGQIIKEFKGMEGMRLYLEYPLKTRRDWEKEFIPRLNPKSPARYPLWWDDYVYSVKERDYPLGIWTGSFFGRVRTWMGLQNFSLAFYDNPSLIHEINDYLAWFVVEAFHKAVDEIQFDFAYIWEDMGMKQAPLCSPRHFREFMLPSYKKVTQFLRDHGIDIILVDSDGNINSLIPLFLESGVTGLSPLEVAAGEDAVALRKKYGQNLMLIGNIDKRVLARSKKEIEIEVLSKVPWLLVQGGYIPQVDHLTPPDVPFENYCYYWNLVKQIAQDPERYLIEAKKKHLL